MTETIGHVPGGTDYPYLKLLSEKFETSRAGEWFCNKISPLVIPPLLALSRLALLPFGASRDAELVELSRHFLDHYAPSIYPTMCKTLELKRYKHWIPEEPSLEVGVGDGYFTSLLLGEDRQITIAGDLIYKTLLAALEHPHFKRSVMMDALAIPLPRNCLQSYMMNNLMHHLPDRHKALAEAHRVVKPGGVFVFTDNTYGWAESVWHMWLAGLLGMKNLKKSLVRAKLVNTIQTLIPDAEWWRREIDPDEWEILELEEFYSNRAYHFTSLLESLTFKQGGLVPPDIKRKILRFPGAKAAIDTFLPPIVETLLSMDEEWTRKTGGTFIFVALKKKATVSDKVNEPEWVCPVTHEPLEPTDTGLAGPSHEYLVARDIPVLIPDWQEVANLREEFERVDKEGFLKFQT